MNKELNGGMMERILQFGFFFFVLMINHKLMFRSHKLCVVCYVMRNHEVLQY
jgi:hypothetical protein